MRFVSLNFGHLEDTYLAPAIGGEGKPTIE